MQTTMILTPINLTYTGSNLGLGSEDTMRLVNVNITTGGNLAVGTLKDLHIGLQDGHMSTFLSVLVGRTQIQIMYTFTQIIFLI